MTRKSCAGIIACGAGLSLIVRPKDIASVNYFAVVGMGDFNYFEMKGLRKKLDKAKTINRFLIYEGRHTWPPEEICRRAIEWMEIQALKKSRKKDQKLINSLYKKELSIAQKFEFDNRVFQAFENYKATEELFSGLHDTEDVKLARSNLEKGKVFKKYRKDKKSIEKKERHYLNQFYKAAALTKNPSFYDIRTKKVLLDLPIKELVKKRMNKNIYDKYSAIRLLAFFRIDIIKTANSFIQKKIYNNASVLYELLVKIDKNKASSLYNLACIYALDNKTKKSITALEHAVNNGFKNIDYIENDKDFRSIKNEKKFKEIISRLKKN